MTDPDCIEFLQWSLPRLGMRWPGLRKVRRQVHKRINRRLEELGFARVAEYRHYLETHTDEWQVLDGLLRISVSRFHRDRGVWDRLRDEVLPELAGSLQSSKQDRLCCWCAGCASRGGAVHAGDSLEAAPSTRLRGTRAGHRGNGCGRPNASACPPSHLSPEQLEGRSGGVARDCVRPVGPALHPPALVPPHGRVPAAGHP